jgi:hypothetical protein
MFSSREIYTLNPSQTRNEIKVELDINSGQGMHVKLVKYLERFDSSVCQGDTALKTCVATMGWGKYDLWPSSALSDCSVQVVKAVRVVSADSKANTGNQIIDVLWTKQSFTDDLNVNLNYIVRHLAARSHQRDGGGGQTITVFVVQVLWIALFSLIPFDFKCRIELIYLT